MKHIDTQYENELFDLMRDPGKHQNVTADLANTDVLAEMDTALTKFLVEHTASEFDVWDGGTMKASFEPAIDEAPFKAAYGEDWKTIFTNDA